MEIKFGQDGIVELFDNGYGMVGRAYFHDGRLAVTFADRVYAGLFWVENGNLVGWYCVWSNLPCDGSAPPAGRRADMRWKRVVSK